MTWSRRDMCFALPILLAASRLSAEDRKLLPSKIFHFKDLPVRHAGSLTYRNMLDGMTYEGIRISLHESDLAPHSAPHPPHRHKSEEVILVVGGELEITINGKATRAGEGSVAFVHSYDLHGIRNPGSTDAQYFILELGLPA